MMRFSSFVSICSYSSLSEDSEEMVEVGVVDGPCDNDDESESAVAAGGAAAAAEADPSRAGVGDELADAICSTDFKRSK